jgi:hypothetical protein
MGLIFQITPNDSRNPWRSKEITGDFFSHNHFIIWQTSSRERSWRHVYLGFGIRRSNKLQWFPIWIIRNNCMKSVMFGFWKLYIEIGYSF